MILPAATAAATTTTTIITATRTSWMDGARSVISRESRRWTRQQVSGNFLRDHSIGCPRASAPTPVVPILVTLYFPIKVFDTSSIDITTTTTITSTTTTDAHGSWMVNGARAVISREPRRWTQKQVSGSLLRDHDIGFPRASAPTPVVPILAALYFPIKAFATPSIDITTNTTTANAGSMVGGAQSVISRESRRWTGQQVSGSLLRDHDVGFPRASAPTPVVPILTARYFPIKVFATSSFDINTTTTTAANAR